MTDATGETVTVRLGAANRPRSVRGATPSVLHQRHDHHPPGLPPGLRRRTATRATTPTSRSASCPPMAEGDALDVPARSTPTGHETQPPARFTEASLVKRLEELGVGRPSTYASIIKTIQDRGYVWKKGTALVPSFTAFAVVNLLEQHFPDLVDYAFTARMEDDLDEIAGGDRGARARGWPSSTSGRPTPTASAHGGLKEMVAEPARRDRRRRDQLHPHRRSIPTACSIVAKPGRDYSPYLQRGDDTASIPDRAGARRAHRREGARAAGRAQGRPRARRRPGHRPAGLRQERPLRALRAAGRLRRRRARPSRRWPRCSRHDPRPHRPSTTRSSCCRCRGWSASTRPTAGDHRRRTAATARTSRRGPTARRTAAASPTRSSCSRSRLDEALALFAQPKMRRGQVGQAAAARARRRPGERQADGDQGRPLRPLRHRRRDQRLAAQGRRRRDHHRRAGLRAAGRSARARPGPKKAAAKKATAKKSTARSDGQEGGGQEGGGQEGRPPRRPAAKKASRRGHAGDRWPRRGQRSRRRTSSRPPTFDRAVGAAMMPDAGVDPDRRTSAHRGRSSRPDPGTGRRARPTIRAPDRITRLFGSRQFFRLWIVQVTSATGDWLGFSAIIVLAARLGGAAGRAPAPAPSRWCWRPASCPASSSDRWPACWSTGGTARR